MIVVRDYFGKKIVVKDSDKIKMWKMLASQNKSLIKILKEVKE